MKFENVTLVDIDYMHVGKDDELVGNYIVESFSDELIDVLDKIRSKAGMKDLVCEDNEVYYNFYLIFNPKKQSIELHGTCNNGEKDDFVDYQIPLNAIEQITLMHKVIETYMHDDYNGNFNRY